LSGESPGDPIVGGLVGPRGGLGIEMGRRISTPAGNPILVLWPSISQPSYHTDQVTVEIVVDCGIQIIIIIIENVFSLRILFR
jgi:hypothetical protein